MRQEKYEQMILEIIADGRGYQAITDLAHQLQVFNSNMVAVVNEIRAEKKAVKKILNDQNIKYREKIEAVKSVFE